MSNYHFSACTISRNNRKPTRRSVTKRLNYVTGLHSQPAACTGAYPIPAGNRIHQVLLLIHCAARIWTEGGDRYPTYGADQSDRLLSQDRSRKRGTGTPGIRCPRGSCESTPEISELPHQSEAGAAGCGHRDEKEGDLNITLERTVSCMTVRSKIMIPTS